MTQREKILGLIVGGLLGVFAILAIYSSVSSALQDKEDELANIEAAITKADAENKRAKRDRERVFDYQKRSLPEDISLSQRDYDAWLYQQAEDAGLQRQSVLPQPITRRTRGSGDLCYQELSFTVIGEGDIKQLAKFLYGFYVADNLHRIRNLNINPVPKSQLLKLRVEIDALIMAKLDPQKVRQLSKRATSQEEFEALLKKVPIGRTVDNLLPLPLEEYESQIAGRNLFAPANQSPQLAQIGQQKGQVGERVTFKAKATDPDDDGVVFALGEDAPDGAKISESGEFSWRPREEQKVEFTLRVTDKGIPAKSAERKVTVLVAAREEGSDTNPASGIDKSKLAVLTGFVQGPTYPAPTICMHLRSEDDFQYLETGDKIRVGDWDGVVTAIDLDRSRARIRTDEGDFVLELGETLADAEFIGAEEL